MCSPSLLRHQIGTQPGASQPQQGGPYSTPGCRARAPHCGGRVVAREGKRECASLPACTPCPGPAKTGHSLRWRGRAQNYPPNILFQKVKEKGPEQPYTKYSVASSKGCTEFLALCSTECVPVVCPPSLLAPSSPRPGRGSRFNLLPPPPRGEFKARPGMTFQPFYLPRPFPLKGGLGHFAKL